MYKPNNIMTGLKALVIIIGIVAAVGVVIAMAPIILVGTFIMGKVVGALLAVCLMIWLLGVAVNASKRLFRYPRNKSS